MEVEFTQFEPVLVEVMDLFERQEAFATGVTRISGGFANAEYDDFDEDYVYITLTWGVQSDCEDRVNREHYKISLYELLNSQLSIKEKVMCIEDA